MTTLDQLNNDCVRGVLDSANIKGKERDKFLKSIADRIDEETNLGFNDSDARARVFEKISKEVDQNAKIRKAQRFAQQNIADKKKQIISQINHENDARVIKAMIDGIESRAPWAKQFSTQSHKLTLQAQRVDDFTRALHDAGLMNLWNYGKQLSQIEGHVFEELRRPGATGNEDATKLAKIIKSFVFDKSMKGLHEALIPIRSIEDFMGTFSRNSERMRSPTGNFLSDVLNYKSWKDRHEQAYQRWKRTELPWWDMEKTFGNLKDNDEEVDKIMREMYNHQTLDVYMKGNNDKNDSVFSGLANVASKRRRIFYKDGYAFAQANKTQ